MKFIYWNKSSSLKHTKYSKPHCSHSHWMLTIQGVASVSLWRCVFCQLHPLSEKDASLSFPLAPVPTPHDNTHAHKHIILIRIPSLTSFFGWFSGFWVQLLLPAFLSLLSLFLAKKCQAICLPTLYFSSLFNYCIIILRLFLPSLVEWAPEECTRPSLCFSINDNQFLVDGRSVVSFGVNGWVGWSRLVWGRTIIVFLECPFLNSISINSLCLLLRWNGWELVQKASLIVP